jgi:hypothetical protein
LRVERRMKVFEKAVAEENIWAKRDEINVNGEN